MEFSDLQAKIVENVKNYGKNYNLDVNQEFAFMKLIEEIGEFTQAKMIHEKKSRPEKFLPEAESKQNLAEELADVVGMSLYLAEILDIDLLKTLEDKWIGREK